MMEVNKNLGRNVNKRVGFGEILRRVQKDFTSLRFQGGKKFAFRPPRTVIIEHIFFECDIGENGQRMALNKKIDENQASLRLMHELGHAILGHRNFRTDVERLRMEREAWEKARELCAEYGVRYDEDLIEAELDTYRDWLHQRSCCAGCSLTRYQTRDGKYHCPRCDFS